MVSQHCALALTDKDLNLNYKSSFTEEIQPFTVSVNDDFLEFTRAKLSLTRFAQDLEDQPPFTDGPPVHNATLIASHWATDYDWSQVEEHINSRFHQFTTILHTEPTSNHKYTEPIPIHFVHHESPRPDAIPLLFVHGWPGSFLEVENLLGPLINPPNDTLPAFHVVAPSIPGYGFSPSPRKAGFGYRQAGATFVSLMRKLGYPKFVFQAGDAGDLICRYAAVDFPENVVSGVSNFWVIPPSPSDLSRDARNETTADERFVIKGNNDFVTRHWAYSQIQQTQPLRLAAAMTDSPVGLAMWIYEAVVHVVVNPTALWTPDRLITWTMMHWINGPYGAFGLYKNGGVDGDGAISTNGGVGMLPFVNQPVAISEFPLDIWYRTPLEWARRGGHVKYRVVHDQGGHFPSMDTPELLIGDIWRFFGDRELSGTEMFGKDP